MTRLGRLVCFGLLTSSAILLAACGSSGSPGAGGARDSITLYNGQHEQTTALLVSAFEKQTGIKVHVRSADEATLGNQILQEQGNSPADVFYTENTPVLELLRERGFLAPVAPATLAAVPRRYDSAQGDWVGVSARVSVLVYNPGQARGAKLPSSILELASPGRRGKDGLAPGRSAALPGGTRERLGAAGAGSQRQLRIPPAPGRPGPPPAATAQGGQAELPDPCTARRRPRAARDGAAARTAVENSDEHDRPQRSARHRRREVRARLVRLAALAADQRRRPAGRGGPGAPGPSGSGRGGPRLR